MTRTPSFSLDPDAGGRLAQLSVGGFDLLYSPNDPSLSPTSWGAFPMVPYAGRISNGRFDFAGSSYRMPINHGQHAIHGTTFTSRWIELAPGHLAIDLDKPWPFGGTVSHRVELHQDSDHSGRLFCELSLLAGHDAMPAMVGWHPWFNRRLTDHGPAAELHFTDFESMEMYELDGAQIPTGRVASPPPPGPWDHPFRSVKQPIVIVWPGQLDVSLRSTCDHWVIFDRPQHAVCVEPQSGPPDIFNGERFDIEPPVLRPGEALFHSFTIEWNIHR